MGLVAVGGRGGEGFQLVNGAAISLCLATALGVVILFRSTEGEALEGWLILELFPRSIVSENERDLNLGCGDSSRCSLLSPEARVAKQQRTFHAGSERAGYAAVLVGWTCQADETAAYEIPDLVEKLKTGRPVGGWRFGQFC